MRTIDGGWELPEPGDRVMTYTGTTARAVRVLVEVEYDGRLANELLELHAFRLLAAGDDTRGV